MENKKWMTLQNLGIVEGTSMVVLIFIAMPLKYLADIPEVVRFVGMAHGMLFMAFVGWVLWEARENRWTIEKTGGAVMASIIPFGPFVADLATETSEEESG